VSAALIVRYRRIAAVRYWKPVQTGTNQDDDTRTVLTLSGEAGPVALDEGIRLPDPLSPHLAARRVGRRLDIAPLVALSQAQDPDTRWVVEGAGGVLVPINETTLMVDLMVELGMPAVVVARTALGTINHTLLTIEALRARQVDVAGIVMNGPPNDENRWSIETYGGVSVVGQLPRLDTVTADGLARQAEAVDPHGRLSRWLA